MNIGQKFGKNLVAAAILAGATVGSAQAYVTKWNFLNEAGFSSSTPAAGAYVVAAGATTYVTGGPFPKELIWPKTDSQGHAIPHQSSLVLSDDVSGTAITGNVADAVLASLNFGVNLTHNNFVIHEPGFLGAVMKDQLWLTPFNGDPTPPGAVGDPVIPPLTFDIRFAETPNLIGGTGICADGTNRATDPLNAAGCRDLFGIQSAGALSQLFQYDNGDGDGLVTYKITIAAVGLGPQNATFCAAVGLLPGCVGFKTFENDDNSLNPFFTIETVVPEPGILALLGAGLAMLGFSRRRKTQV